MEILSLSIAVLALIIALAAYYRTGNNKTIHALERALDEKIDRLGAMAERAAGSMAAVASGPVTSAASV